MVHPSLEYLHQYEIKRLLVPENTDEQKNQWALEFSNGVIVTNNDEYREAPLSSQVEGRVLITTMYSTDSTRARIGRVKSDFTVVDDSIIEFTPGKYSIIDPRFDGGEPYTPQAGLMTDATDLQTIRDEFDTRAAEAPEPPSEDEEAETRAETPDDAREAENASESQQRIHVPGRPEAELS